MKKICLLFIAVFGMLVMHAQQRFMGEVVKVKDLHVAKNDSNLLLSMLLDVSGVKDMGRNHQLLLTPALVVNNEIRTFSDVLLTGKHRYYAYLRNPEKTGGATLYRAGEVQEITIRDVLPYEKAMEALEVVMLSGDCDCLCQVEQDRMETLAKFDYTPYHPTFAWVVPTPGKDSVVVEGQALVDFRVNRTELDENYRNNKVEIQKILNTIDVVRNDPDCSITHVHIKGHASPEGSYANNTRLAQGRTETLKNYVREQYHFAPEIVTSAFDPEDWNGLRDSVMQSDLANKDRILELIDDLNMEPDQKDWTIKRKYPRDYTYMLLHYYPGLRRSDYRVVYKIRDYTDIEEAKKVYQEAPAKLSLRELFDVANTYEPGSEDFQHVLETAALLFPENEVANLNAANAALARKDYRGAEKYLNRSGDSPQVNHARGVLAALKEDYATARDWFEKALQGGVAEAENNLKELERLENNKIINNY